MTAIALIDPKHVYNIGGVVRAAACYNVDTVYYWGDRLSWTDRLPRELRKLYPVELVKCFAATAIMAIARDQEMTPVCVENVEGFEQLPAFIHPKNPMYIFGPEDGQLNGYIRRGSQRHVRIPAEFSLNLSAAVYTVLYDRLTKGM